MIYAGSDSVKLVDTYYPYVKIGSTWKPICGHYFWDNDIGAAIFCKKLGYPEGGVLVEEGKPYKEDALYVGRCESENITNLEDGCTKQQKNSSECETGNPVSVKVICKGKQAYNIIGPQLNLGFKSLIN